MSFFSPDWDKLAQAIYTDTWCPFCGSPAKSFEARRTRFDIRCRSGHTYSLTAPQMRQALPKLRG